MISLRRRMLVIARTNMACFPGNYTKSHLCCSNIKLIKVYILNFQDIDLRSVSKHLQISPYGFDIYNIIPNRSE